MHSHAKLFVFVNVNVINSMWARMSPCHQLSSDINHWTNHDYTYKLSNTSPLGLGRAGLFGIPHKIIPNDFNEREQSSAKLNVTFLRRLSLF